MEYAETLTAKQVADDLLDRSGRALSTGDFDLFAGCFQLPNVMTTQQKTVIVEDRDHLKRLFDGMRTKLRDSGVTELARYVEAAEFRSPTQMTSTHITQAIAGGVVWGSPYPVFSIVEFIDGKWLGVSSEYAVKPRSAQDNAILGSRYVPDMQRVKF